MGTDPPRAPRQRVAKCGGPALSLPRSCRRAKSMTHQFGQPADSVERGFAILPSVPARSLDRARPMTNETQPPEPEAPGETIAAAYRVYFDILEYIAARKVRVPDDDVRGVVHDVFLAFMRNHATIQDERSWLVGAMCIQC